jgi:ABC-type lipoprotein export system ATPase subunit
MFSLGLIVALKEVNKEFHMGNLTCIIGAVGSGKSELIQMLALGLLANLKETREVK